MYFDYPENNEAYDYDHQYMFGEVLIWMGLASVAPLLIGSVLQNLLVSPVITPLDAATGMVQQALWLPPVRDMFLVKSKR